MDMRPSPTRLPPTRQDAILASLAAFEDDRRPGRINLGIGMYYDEMGAVPLLDCVRRAEMRLAQAGMTRGYGPVDGDAKLRALVPAVLGFDESHGVAVCQTLGGTGALSLGAALLRDMMEKQARPIVALSTPTWTNHGPIFEAAGFKTVHYRYHDARTGEIDFEGMCADLAALPAGAVVLLHGCCHNPTGLDPNPEQWNTIVDLLHKCNLVAVLDLAYLGFGDGIEKDAAAARRLVSHRVPTLIALSFSKSFALYGERIGALVVPDCAGDTGQRLVAHIQTLARAAYSMPPVHGAALVRTVLEDPDLNKLWLTELENMRTRVVAMRRALVDGLHESAPWRTFDFITSQKGLFSYTGLSVHEVTRLRCDHAVYIVPDGRLCIAGLNATNVGAVARAIADVTTPVVKL